MKLLDVNKKSLIIIFIAMVLVVFGTLTILIKKIIENKNFLSYIDNICLLTFFNKCLLIHQESPLPRHNFIKKDLNYLDNKNSFDNQIISKHRNINGIKETYAKNNTFEYSQIINENHIIFFAKNQFRKYLISCDGVDEELCFQQVYCDDFGHLSLRPNLSNSNHCLNFCSCH
ncbi:uncharacterized protein ASCRUDRAFT_13849 [Ascoidea rubescens DSM 1968]|uniref:Uncharacterized protein n=1 Tax=Ascoidea rubescens DSM 1968 TaxID=1344418 RepID=A0A1D2VH97_9ASCO|nr:hypothetical protein ASCRUDRAFT_13849 [Ascoidea rubescens DSM 1968]ODV60857.1 hypothetical protein ASCRUDRAFT_13849 [Ascoidea rubescens DSM 1968]